MQCDLNLIHEMLTMHFTVDKHKILKKAIGTFLSVCHGKLSHDTSWILTANYFIWNFKCKYECTR